MNQLVIVVDLQSKFLAALPRAGEITRRAEFVVRAANALKVPVVATEQNPSRFGETVAELQPFVSRRIPKMRFSAAEAVPKTRPDRVVLLGAEAHICVALTALDLAEECEVIVLADAVASRTDAQRDAGLDTAASAGAIVMHSETWVYQTLGSAEHAAFREVLNLVKEFSRDAA